MSLSQIEADVNGVANLVRNISGTINNLANNALLGILPGIGDVLRGLRAAVGDILNRIGRVAGAIRDQAAKAVESIVPSAIQFIQGFIGGIANDIHWLLSNLATAEQFAAGFVSEAAKHVPGLAAAVEGAISGGLGSGLLGLFKFLEGQEAAVVDHMLDELLKEKNLLPWMRTMIAGLRGRGAEWQIFALPLIVGTLIVGSGEAMADPILQGLRQESNAKVQTSVRSPAELIEARLKNVISLDTFHGEMARNNYNFQRSDEMLRARQERLLPEEAARLVFRGQMHLDDAQRELADRGIAPGRTAQKVESLRPILGPDDIRDIYLRGYMNEAQHDAMLSQHGFSHDNIARRKSLYYLIPGPQDLIHMAIRNVFSPEIVERFQLFGDFPPAFEHAAAQQGISRDWALKFWGAHWIVPSNQEGFEMFHRTTLASEDQHHDTFTLSDGTKVENVIGRSTLQLLLREKDTAPYYRNKLTEIAYNPLTRIDVRRMHKVGSLTHAGVERAYLDLGYSPLNARRLADYVERLNSQEQKDQYASLINGIQRRILSLYQQAKIDRLDADMALHDLGVTDDEIKFYFAEADLIVATDDAQAVENGIGKLYIGDLITAAQAESRLTEAGVTEHARKRLFSKWDIAREFKDLSADHVKARELTKSEILTANKDGLLPDPDTLRLLHDLGYDEFSANTELAVAHYQQERETRKNQIDAVKALYINMQYDYLTASNALDGLKMPALQRDALLSEWKLTREQRVEKLPLATIRDMVKAQFLTDDEATDQLRRHRYNDADIDNLISFWRQPTTGGRQRRGTVA